MELTHTEKDILGYTRFWIEQFNSLTQLPLFDSEDETSASSFLVNYDSFFLLNKKLFNVLNVSAIKDVEIVIMLKCRDWSHFKMNYLYNLDMIAFENHSVGI